MNKGEMDNAVRRALNIFDKWNEVTGFVPEHTGYYYEIQSLIEDAVHCGAQAALGIKKPIGSEKDDNEEFKPEKGEECGQEV